MENMKETKADLQSEADLGALLFRGHDGICCVQLSLTAESFGVLSTQGPGIRTAWGWDPCKGKAHIQVQKYYQPTGSRLALGPDDRSTEAVGRREALAAALFYPNAAGFLGSRQLTCRRSLWEGFLFRTRTAALQGWLPCLGVLFMSHKTKQNRCSSHGRHPL